jgi:phosphoglycerate dehydrogenase-like enzyme
MSRYTVLISAPYMQPVVDRFRPVFAAHDIDLVVPDVEERMEEDDLLAVMGGIDGVICGDDRFTARVVETATDLKVIAKWGTGIDSIDQAACAAQGVAVRNTPDAFSEPVADTVLGYMLCFARNLPAMTQAMRAGVWHKIPGFALREATLGIVGVGDVGKAVARRAAAFGTRLLGCDPAPMPGYFLKTTPIEMVDQATLLRESDFVSLNCDLNPTSHHLMDAQAFALMKPTAVVINTARGPIIDEPALVEALQEGQIRGAALDVFEHEPLPTDSPLLAMDDVMVAPHNANSSPEAWEHVHRNTIRNLLGVLLGEDADPRLDLARPPASASAPATA